ncbi:hypothetical protein OHS33_39600 (plasmid) [Streptomyces sp. NBC_00536]|uniref:hypothetical protein n=1 Tax=Streptomyces sp. NBC_00536 TaxID=2975769 RepID=UPI002E80A047|nr:hypothetical protein [Streptomyces sp. NBC_00536]WUC84473.1 hypothetical protein OHS33_39600 [Streptomyces sp. NBC_00536]
MSGITDGPSSTPTPQDVALAEQLVALTGEALSGATPLTAELIRAHNSHIALLDRQAPVVAAVLSMCRAAAERWQANGFGHFSVARSLPSMDAALTSLVQAAVDGDADAQLTERVRRACAASPDDASRLIAISSGVHAILEAGPSRFPATAAIEPIEPKRLPDLRARLIAAQQGKNAVNRLARALLENSGTLVPFVDSPDDAARVLLAQENNRLAKARLYHVDEEMTEAAIRKAERGRKGPLALHRVPSEYGLIAFGKPLVRTVLDDGERPADVVAVSWGPWAADFAHAPKHIQPTSVAGPRQPFWGYFGLDEGVQYVEPVDGREHPAWWLTLWTRPRHAIPGTPPLLADNETTVGASQSLEPMLLGTTDEISHVVYACWDFITQEQVTKRPIAEQRVQERKPTDLRRDRRKGVEDDSAVHLITLRGRRPQPAVSAPAAPVPGGRTLDYRQVIAEYDRSHCMNPRLHRDDPDKKLHHHEEITVVEYVRGPDGAPLRPTKESRTVHQLTAEGDGRP